ncbi:hypothetical protein M885DRAFT_521293 [Pelagophyceae sp. CCMP2097]|nr:hypothetical protein M885DRAFT_521293 [Pelagophyceae sp. CCMP2097]
MNFSDEMSLRARADDHLGLMSLFGGPPPRDEAVSPAARDAPVARDARGDPPPGLLAARSRGGAGPTSPPRGRQAVASAAADDAAPDDADAPDGWRAATGSFHDDEKILATSFENAAEAHASDSQRRVEAVALAAAEEAADVWRQRKEKIRLRWDNAKRTMDERKLLDPTEAPLPLYRDSFSTSSRSLEPKALHALTGVTFRARILQPPQLDASLPPPTKREAVAQLPRWLKHSPGAMAPANRPEVLRAERVFSYSGFPPEAPAAPAAAAPAPAAEFSADEPDLSFDSCFESGNLLSATRIYRSSDEAFKPPPGGKECAVPWVVSSEYDLQMHPDVHSRGNTQWFFFAVRRAVKGMRVRLNITNFAKADSLYLDGMQPLLYSTKAASGGVGWRRAGDVVCYSRNTMETHLRQLADMKAAVGVKGDGDDDDESGSGSGGDDDELSTAELPAAEAVEAETPAEENVFDGAVAVSVEAPPVAPPMRQAGTHTLTFDVDFEFDEDLVFLAYSQPYTFTNLQSYLASLSADSERAATFTRKILCESIGGNNVDVLTITEKPTYSAHSDYANDGATPNGSAPAVEARQKRLIVLSARVHPGESNASWVMQGLLGFLTSQDPAATVLRRRFIFKCVPMLNPDGVIHGNYRCSLSGQDLNRQWHHPSWVSHPPIAALKSLIGNYQKRDAATVALFCDVHGHSRAKGVFLYGILTAADREDDRRQKRRFKAEAQRDATAAAADHAAAVAENAAAKKAGGVAAPTKAPRPKRGKASLRPGDPRHFPAALARRAAGMCPKAKPSFKLGKGKANTARAVVCRELDVRRSFTLEVSFCGGVSGAHRDAQFTSQDLIDLGKMFCLALVDFFELGEAVATQVKLHKLAAARDAASRSAAGDAATDAADDAAARAPSDAGGYVGADDGAAARSGDGAAARSDEGAAARSDESDAAPRSDESDAAPRSDEGEDDGSRSAAVTVASRRTSLSSTSSSREQSRRQSLDAAPLSEADAAALARITGDADILLRDANVLLSATMRPWDGSDDDEAAAPAPASDDEADESDGDEKPPAEAPAEPVAAADDGPSDAELQLAAERDLAASEREHAEAAEIERAAGDAEAGERFSMAANDIDSLFEDDGEPAPAKRSSIEALVPARRRTASLAPAALATAAATAAAAALQSSASDAAAAWMRDAHADAGALPNISLRPPATVSNASAPQSGRSVTPTPPASEHSSSQQRRPAKRSTTTTAKMRNR